jgi:hypothetical protein
VVTASRGGVGGVALIGIDPKTKQATAVGPGSNVTPQAPLLRICFLPAPRTFRLPAMCCKTVHNARANSPHMRKPCNACGVSVLRSLSKNKMKEEKR